MPVEGTEERETGTGRVQGDEGRLINRWGRANKREKKNIFGRKERAA